MKKALLIIALGLIVTIAILTSSCRTLKVGSVDFKVLTIDGCQYIYRNSGEGCMFSHKGNCNNPIHKTDGTICN
jgi:hypothetical protein